MAEPLPTHCLNCGRGLDGPYCAQCGQKNRAARVALGPLLREVLGEAFQVDGKVIRTLKPLFFKPGFLTREYNAGRRAAYTSPFRLFLAAALLWWATGYVVSKTADLEVGVSIGSKDEQILAIGNSRDAASMRPQGELAQTKILRSQSSEGPLADVSPVREHVDKRIEWLQQLSPTEQRDFMVERTLDAFPKAILLLVPLLALILKLLFVRRGILYVEHLVFALHFHTMAFVVLALSFVVPDPVVQLLVMPAFAGYGLLALRRTYDLSWRGTLGRFALVFLVYGTAALVVTLATIVVMVLL